jgi:hypothetical protein
LQVDPEQQPPGHEVALQPLHAPASPHPCPAGQLSQVAPPDPHALGAVPSTHAPALQQPGHEVAVHWHASLTHERPAPHALSHAPHAPPSHVSWF